MWTIKARELMLQAMNEIAAPGVVVSVFDGTQLIVSIDINEPATRIESGALIFSEAEAISTESGLATRVEISAGGSVLLELVAPDEIQVEPSQIVPGSMVQIKSLLIQ